MNGQNNYAIGLISTALGLLLLTTGCHHGPAKITTPVTETQAPATRPIPRPDIDPAERRLQDQITAMQEQVQALSTQVDRLAQLHGTQMSPQWLDKVKAARADASRTSERIRYLEATHAILARRLQALRAEFKVYQQFEASDPSIPRP